MLKLALATALMGKKHQVKTLLQNDTLIKMTRWAKWYELFCILILNEEEGLDDFFSYS
jgi:hypothetical protein